MFCTKCGNELYEGELFCTRCGVRINVAQPENKEAKLDKSSNRLTEAIRDFQGGNQASFEQIYNLSNRYVYYTIIKSVRDSEIANDVLQETYLEVFKSLSSLKNPEAFLGWVGTIAQHKITHYFKKNPTNSMDDETEDMINNLSETDSELLPEDSMENKEVQRMISEIIDELPMQQRKTIVAFYYNQMSISEIAAAMEVPENTVKTWLSRGKNKIKDGVMDLEKKHGTKLYSIALAPVLFFLFGEEASACEVPISGIALLQSLAPNAVPAATPATTVASVGGNTAKVVSIAKWKLIAATVAGAVVVTGIGAGTAVFVKDRIDNRVEETEEYADYEIEATAGVENLAPETEEPAAEPRDEDGVPVSEPETEPESEPVVEKKQITNIEGMGFPTEEEFADNLRYYDYWMGFYYIDGNDEMESLTVEDALLFAIEYLMIHDCNEWYGDIYSSDDGMPYKIPKNDVIHAMDDLFGQTFDLSQYGNKYHSIGALMENDYIKYRIGDYGEGGGPRRQVKDIVYYDDGSFTVKVTYYCGCVNLDNRWVMNDERFYVQFDCRVAPDKPLGYVVTDIRGSSQDINGFGDTVEDAELDGYIFWDSDSRKLTEDDLVGLSSDELRIARNEIYARKGFIFDKEDMRNYFNTKSWYNGTIPSGEFDTSVYFNEYETYNVNFIRQHE